MINKIFGYFKGAGTSTNSIKENISHLKLLGTFYKKVVGEKKEMMGEECTLYMSIVNDKTFDYNLNVYNDEYQFSSKKSFNFLDTWENISFALTNDRGLKFC